MAVTLNYVPHAAQVEIHEARDRRFRTVCTGRRFGKTLCLAAEMKRYEYEISATGHISYNAPSGYHDDCVIALALANQGRWQMGNAGRMLRIGVRGGRDGTPRSTDRRFMP